MKPYYQDSAVTIYHGDCREVAPCLGKFDLLWTDPPYNVGKDYGKHNDAMPLDEYLSWCSQWLDIAKLNCSSVALYPPKKHLLWFWNQIPSNHQVICAWSPEGAIRGKYVHQYAPLLLPPSPKVRCKDHWWNVQVPGLGYFFREETYGHPGYTSQDITTRVLMTHTLQGETIIDYFGGTGTSGRVAKDLGRKATLIELEERYCEIAARRMEEEVLPIVFDEPKPKPYTETCLF